MSSRGHELAKPDWTMLDTGYRDLRNDEVHAVITANRDYKALIWLGIVIQDA